ncbi:ubiquitin-binding protein [Saccharomycopsis crataegensis]|uniref:Ubiquitin-binding protein n=1 Tax=Saccharomycopsis crataegensis TaxID=43959 RepID=A0AAV5QSM9_9ASCO|nr:ubiquitin-binding protein [Saccharomycopsis crataegensis]
MSAEEEPKKSAPETVAETLDDSGSKKVTFNDNHTPSPEKLSSPTEPLDNLSKSPSILKKSGEKPPPRPPRPLSPRQKAKKTLQDAFPNMEEKYINAVLIASEGDLNPAFNALLYLSDPESKVEVPEPKQKPPVPSRNRHKSLQMQEDERLARRLAREFNKPEVGSNPQPNTRSANTEEPDVINQFLDEDLPQLKKQFEKGFEETRQKVGTFFSGITKQLQGDDDSDEEYSIRYKPNRSLHNSQSRIDKTTRINTMKNRKIKDDEDGQLFGALGSLGSPPVSARSSATFKRNEYEGDMPVEQFSTITLTNNDKDLPDVPIVSSKLETVDATNPQNSGSVCGDAKPPSNQNSKSSSEPVDTKKGGASKWEPLTDVPPQPITDDAFLVTSSDDEDEDDEETKTADKK